MGDSVSSEMCYCPVVCEMCKRKYFEDCAVLRRLECGWYFDSRGFPVRGQCVQVFLYDCPRAYEAVRVFARGGRPERFSIDSVKRYDAKESFMDYVKRVWKERIEMMVF